MVRSVSPSIHASSPLLPVGAPAPRSGAHFSPLPRPPSQALAARPGRGDGGPGRPPAPPPPGSGRRARPAPPARPPAPSPPRPLPLQLLVLFHRGGGFRDPQVVLADRRLQPISRNVQAKHAGRNDRRKAPKTEGGRRSRGGAARPGPAAGRGVRGPPGGPAPGPAPGARRAAARPSRSPGVPGASRPLSRRGGAGSGSVPSRGREPPVGAWVPPSAPYSLVMVKGRGLTCRPQTTFLLRTESGLFRICRSTRSSPARPQAWRGAVDGMLDSNYS